METNETLFGTREYATPVDTYAGSVNLKSSLAQLDAPLKIIDDYNPLGLNAHNVDRQVADEYSASQEMAINELAQGDIYGAARKAQQAAKGAARRKADRNNVAGRVEENLKLSQDYQAKETAKVAQGKVDAGTSDFLRKKSDYTYGVQGGVGKYGEDGRALDPKGFNSYTAIESAEAVDLPSLLKSGQEGFEKQKQAWANDKSDGKYLSIEKGANEFVQKSNVKGYMKDYLTNNTAFMAATIQEIEAKLYQDLISSGKTSDEAMEITTSPEGQATVQDRLNQKVETLAEQSAEKKKVWRETRDKTKSADPLYQDEAAYERENPYSDPLVVVDKPVAKDNEKISTPTNLNNSILNAKKSSSQEAQKITQSIAGAMNKNLLEGSFKSLLGNTSSSTLQEAMSNNYIDPNKPIDEWDIAIMTGELVTTDEITAAMIKGGDKDNLENPEVRKTYARHLIQKGGTTEGDIAGKLYNNPLFRELANATHLEKEVEKLEVKSLEYRDLQGVKNEVEEDLRTGERTKPRYAKINKVTESAEALGLSPKLVEELYSSFLDKSTPGSKSSKELLEFELPKLRQFYKAYTGEDYKLTGLDEGKEGTNIERSNLVSILNRAYGTAERSSEGNFMREGVPINSSLVDYNNFMTDLDNLQDSAKNVKEDYKYINKVREESLEQRSKNTYTPRVIYGLPVKKVTGDPKKDERLTEAYYKKLNDKVRDLPFLKNRLFTYIDPVTGEREESKDIMSTFPSLTQANIEDKVGIQLNKYDRKIAINVNGTTDEDGNVISKPVTLYFDSDNIEGLDTYFNTPEMERERTDSFILEKKSIGQRRRELPGSIRREDGTTSYSLTLLFPDNSQTGTAGTSTFSGDETFKVEIVEDGVVTELSGDDAKRVLELHNSHVKRIY